MPSLRHADMLGSRHFAITMGAAFLLHVGALYVWSQIPSPTVIDIPVRALNIKLGEEGTLTNDEIKAMEPNLSNSSAVENTIARLVRDQEYEAQRTESMVKSMDKAMDTPDKTIKPAPKYKVGTLHKFDMRNEGVKTSAPVTEVTAHQFVRDVAPPKIESKPVAKKDTAKAVGLKVGNSNSKEAEMIARYEQLISLWIQKFKLYPEDARADGMQGETVVRIRIDRRGNVRYYTLERSTGYPVLDRAAVDMIRRANPVPAVPVDYPPGEVLEFLIPVHFSLQ